MCKWHLAQRIQARQPSASREVDFTSDTTTTLLRCYTLHSEVSLALLRIETYAAILEATASASGRGSNTMGSQLPDTGFHSNKKSLVAAVSSWQILAGMTAGDQLVCDLLTSF